MQWITREMVARMGRRESLLCMAMADGEWERAAARWLVVTTLWALALLVVGLWLVGA